MADFGANQFTFIGKGVRIFYLTHAPGPIRPGQEGGVLEYQGPEGSRLFSGSQITIDSGLLGAMVTVPLKLNADAGGLTATILIPQVLGVSREVPVDFDTILIRAVSRGKFETPGPALTYTTTVLRAVARIVIQPA